MAYLNFASRKIDHDHILFPVTSFALKVHGLSCWPTLHFTRDLELLESIVYQF